MLPLVLSFKPNALTKRRSKYLGFTKPSSYLLFIMKQLSSSSSFAAS